MPTKTNAKKSAPLIEAPEVSSPAAKSDVLAIDIQVLLTPIAIIIAGLIIGLGIYFGLTNSDATRAAANNSGTPAAPAAQAPTDQQAAPAVPTPTTPAVTSIDDDAYLGDKSKAKVAIVEFSDFECSYCRRHFQEVYPLIKANYIDTGKIIYVFRDLPLPRHDPAATRMAIAAECVKEQKGNQAYFDYHNLLFTNTSANGRGVGGDDVLAGFAGRVGADESAFLTCLTEERYAAEVQKDMADANAIGISGTPGFVVGRLAADGTVTGIKVPGAYPYDTFAASIEQHL